MSDTEKARCRVILYFSFVALLVLTYSAIKWYKVTAYAISFSAMVGLLFVVVSCFFMRLSLGLVLCSNIYLLGAFVHATNLCYQLGGLDSSHVYWMPTIFMIAFLVTNRFWGGVWFFIVMLTCGLAIYLEASGYVFPSFPLEGKAIMVDSYSGYLLPLLVVWLGQYYATLMRENGVKEVEISRDLSAQSAKKAQNSEENLSRILTKAKGMSETLMEGSSSLSTTFCSLRATSLQLTQDADLQVGSAMQIRAVANRTSQSIVETEKSVVIIDNYVRDASRDVSSSVQAMSDATHSIAKIQNSFERIEGTLGIINHIASQTNLLALNASIEAARAGENGRGFAVVADEVRSLSLQSHESVKEIAKILALSSKEVREGGDYVRCAANLLAETSQGVEDVRTRVTLISEAIEEQTKAIAEVASVAERVESTSVNNADAIKSLFEHASEMTQLSTTLLTLSEEMHSAMNPSV